MPLEDTLDVTALLHGDDPGLILLIDPDKEGLGLVVEDATALGPVTLHTSDLQVGVTGHEEEVVIDELLADLLVHASQGVVGTSQVTIEPLEGSGDKLLNTNTLLLGDLAGAYYPHTHPQPLFLYFSPSFLNIPNTWFRPLAPDSRMSLRTDTTQSGLALQLSSNTECDVNSMISGGSKFSTYLPIAHATMSLDV